MLDDAGKQHTFLKNLLVGINNIRVLICFAPGILILELRRWQAGLPMGQVQPVVRFCMAPEVRWVLTVLKGLLKEEK